MSSAKRVFSLAVFFKQNGTPADGKNPTRGCLGGRGEIRTHGGLAPTTVFKTVALNRSATLPSVLTKLIQHALIVTILAKAGL